MPWQAMITMVLRASYPGNYATLGCLDGEEMAILVVFGRIWMHPPSLTLDMLVLLLLATMVMVQSSFVSFVMVPIQFASNLGLGDLIRRTSKVMTDYVFEGTLGDGFCTNH